jgi:hypothetical protein
MLDDAKLRKLPALPLWEVIDRLVALEQRARDADKAARVPAVALTLAGGGQLTGWLMAHGPAGPRRPLLVALADARGERTDHLAYVDVGQVAAVTVLGAAGALEALGGGALDPVDGAPSPGALQLRRQADESASHLSRLLGVPLELGLDLDGNVLADVARAGAVLSELVRLTATALDKLAADAFARDVLRTKVKRVIMGFADVRRVDLVSGTLSVRVPAGGGVSERFNAATLAEALNKAL